MSRRKQSTSLFDYFPKRTRDEIIEPVAKITVDSNAVDNSHETTLGFQPPLEPLLEMDVAVAEASGVLSTGMPYLAF